MQPKLDITFREVNRPVTELVTKFGGQPVWLEEPQWPVSRWAGAPMQFICQIAIHKKLFPDSKARMAYVFMTNDSEYLEAPGLELRFAGEPNSGENAIVLQPGVYDGLAVGNARGPVLHGWRSDVREEAPKGLWAHICQVIFAPAPPPQPPPRQVLVEYAVELTPGEDPDYIPCARLGDVPMEEYCEYLTAIDSNKIGGVPYWIQDEALEFQRGGPWRLLLQFDVEGVPFELDALFQTGVLRVFINEQGTRSWLNYDFD